MTDDKLNRFWLIVTGLLIIIIIASSLVIGLRHQAGQPIQIDISQTPDFQGYIYVDGAVVKPGTYPVNTNDKLEDILQASGGISANANPAKIYLHIPQDGENNSPQKIDINRAEVWLLQALPGIGEVRAKAIVDYRLENEPFQNIEDITKVPGINNSIFEKIKGYITIME